jgi:hypothetical protein
LLAGAVPEGTKVEARATPGLPVGPGTAYVFDLPGAESIERGLALLPGACLVPMFNTTSDPGEYVPTRRILEALGGAASGLAPQSAGAPVFLLDADRQGPFTPPPHADYDNRWYVFASDFPPAAKLQAAGVDRLVIVVAKVVQPDLRDALAAHALRRQVFDVATGSLSPFPEDRVTIVRGLSTFERTLHKNFDGSFGHRVSHG